METINKAKMCKEVISIISEITEKSELSLKINNSSSIIEDIGLDSLQMIAFLMQLEEVFNIEIEFETLDISHLETIEKTVEYICTLKSTHK